MSAYTLALASAPNSAVLYANRALSHLKLAVEHEPDGSTTEKLRPKALQDATRATELDPRYAKGWVRLAEALLAAGEDDAGLAPEKRAEGRRVVAAGVRQALENAVRAAPERSKVHQGVRDGSSQRLWKLMLTRGNRSDKHARESKCNRRVRRHVIVCKGVVVWGTVWCLG